MRISDWSSDVCSSDLPIGGRSVNEAALEARYRFGNFGVVGFVDAGQVYRSSAPTFQNLRFGAGIGARYRSEERRVGKECVSTCRSRWSPYNQKKNTKNKNTTENNT